MKNNKKGAMPRRDFLKFSALGAAAAMTAPSILASCAGGGAKITPLKQPGEYYIPDLIDKAPDGRPLKAGLVGCGGRGIGAAFNFLRAANGVSVVALGDVFQDRIDDARTRLQNDGGQTIAPENCFVGFDAYKKVIDAGVDVVILCTPPAFRPAQFKYAVDKGVHSFIEKPVSVDSEGYRSIVASARVAASKNLTVITGTQRHHQRSYIASYKKIMEGAIGEIRGGTVYWNQSQLWYRTKQKGWTDMEWMIRDWVNWTWLNGDEIIEQHVHNIDVFTWFSGLKPISAVGVGSRQRRVTGDGYDNFSIDFEFPGGIHLHSMCRQIDGTAGYVGEKIQGTKGVWINDWDKARIEDFAGNVVWQYDHAADEGRMNDPYVLEHVNLVASIREGKAVNQAEETAISTLAGIMGRDAAYTGAKVTWEEASAKTHGMVPDESTLAMVDMDMTKYVVPVPGTGK